LAVLAFPESHYSRKKMATMKHPSIALAALLGIALLTPALTQAASLAYEGFDYAPDQTVSGLTGGSGWAAAWATGSGAFVGTNTAGSLTYQDSMGNNLATTGGKLAVGSPLVPFSTTASPNRAMLNASSTYTTLGALAAANPLEAGTVWVSFLYHRPDQAANPYHRQANLGLFQGSGEKLAVGAPNTSATVSDPNLSIWSSGGAHPGATPLQSTVSSFSPSAQLIVLKIAVDEDALTRDDVWAWFNPTDLLASLNPATALASEEEVDLSGVTTFRFQAGNNNANGPNSYWYADELRIGYSSLSVTPVPEPSTLCLVGLGILTALIRVRRS
jgi:hypothetical protein